MAGEDVIAVLGGWEGFEIEQVRRTPGTRTTAPIVEVELRRTAGAVIRCSRCGKVVDEVHEVSLRRIRELPILDADAWLLVPTARVLCPDCGPTVESLSWMDRYQRMTKRFAESVARLTEMIPIKQVAHYYSLSWHTVKAIDKRALEQKLGPVDFSGVRQIAMDEFAIHRGQTYATVVVEPKLRRVLWVGRGNGREDIRKFFELLGRDGCEKIEAAVMDMSDAYEYETRAQCPNVTIVYDLFHMIAQFMKHVVDRVRMDETYKIARFNPERSMAIIAARRVIKGTKFLLLRNRENLTPSQQIRLKELLSINRRLWVAYVLKDAFRDLWRHTNEVTALHAWKQWYSWAVRCRIPAIVRYAKKLKIRVPGIVAHSRYALNTSFLEGMNNKIKVMKRMAYGYRDDDYFFLKIRAAFPGIRR